jgi:hypothetical protein
VRWQGTLGHGTLPTNQDKGSTSKLRAFPDESAETLESFEEEEITEMFETNHHLFLMGLPN